MSDDMIPRTEAQAMVAAALTEAAEEMEAMRGPTDVPRTDKAVVFDEAADRCIEITRALITGDAQTALTKMLREARAKALTEAADICDMRNIKQGDSDYITGVIDASQADAARIRALIDAPADARAAEVREKNDEQ